MSNVVNVIEMIDGYRKRCEEDVKMQPLLRALDLIRTTIISESIKRGELKGSEGVEGVGSDTAFFGTSKEQG